MRIKHIYLQNFCKFYGSNTLDADIYDRTEISGENETGKSTIKRVIHYIFGCRDENGKEISGIRPHDKDGNDIDGDITTEVTVNLHGNKDTPGAELAAFQRLLELIVFISRCYDAPPAENLAAVMRVGRIISLLESEFMREWRLEELAKLAATSPNNLLRLFRTVTGTSPVDYLIRVRLRRAAEALKNTPGAVAEIAADCGFADSNYFARKFRAAYGVSPREFRKRPL